MNALSYLKFTFFILLFSFELAGQTNTDSNCENELKGFIVDTQEYLIDQKDNSTFDLVFYPGFTYRLQLCTLNTKISLSLTLVDAKGNEQFKSNISQGFYRDFKFDTAFHGKLQVKPISVNKQPAQIIIGYKKNNK